MLVLGLDTSTPAVSARRWSRAGGAPVAESVVVDAQAARRAAGGGVREVLAGRRPARSVAVGGRPRPGRSPGCGSASMTAAALADALWGPGLRRLLARRPQWRRRAVVHRRRPQGGLLGAVRRRASGSTGPPSCGRPCSRGRSRTSAGRGGRRRRRAAAPGCSRWRRAAALPVRRGSCCWPPGGCWPARRPSRSTPLYLRRPDATPRRGSRPKRVT